MTAAKRRMPSSSARVGMAALGLCSLLACSTLAPGRAEAQANSAVSKADAEAKAAFAAGRDAYDRGRFAEALRGFERAYELSGHPKLLFNIGRAAESDGKNARAIEAYERYLQSVPQADNREFVEGRLSKLRESIGMAPHARANQPIDAPAPYVTPQPQNGSDTSAGASGFSGEPRFQVYGGFLSGFGGKTKATGSYMGMSLADLGLTDSDTQHKLATTLGFQLGGSYVWRFLGIGPELRMSWLKIKPDATLDTSGQDRDKLIDLLIKPRGRYRFNALPLEIYLAVPVGLSIPRFQKSEGTSFRVGPTVGMLAGATYFFLRHLGANLELGGQWHWVGAKITDAQLDGEINAKLRYSQFHLHINAVAAF